MIASKISKWSFIVGILWAGFCHAAESPKALSEPNRRAVIDWIVSPTNAHQVAVEVSGLDPAALRKIEQEHWSNAQWQRLLSVYAEQGGIKSDAALPPMLGSYRMDSGKVRFEPQFPLEPRVRYRAVFELDGLPGRVRTGETSIVATFQLPEAPAAPSTVVAQIYPTADVLPENLLKFYVYFSAPMSRGHIYEHIHLQNEQGKEIELPFLEIDEELWNPSMTRLTLFIDPGRIKRGVRPLEEVGPSLEAGKRFTLIIDREWSDGAGNVLKEAFRKTFRVDSPERDALDPDRWTIQPPKAGTRDLLAVTFPKPLDHALAQRLMRVGDATGGGVSGAIEMADQERRWLFTPEKPWTAGRYQLAVQTTLEDLAGNNIGKPFEVDLFEGVQRKLTNSFVKLPFEVR